MNFNIIKQLDIANGPGCRVSLFVQGCEFNCPGCFNPIAQDFKSGIPFTEDTKKLLFQFTEPEYITGLSILGGEPLHPNNRDTVLQIAREFKEKYPNKTVWIWTGYVFEDIKELIAPYLNIVDVVVDGPFIEDLRDPRLEFRGSSNQRIINVRESLLASKTIFY